MNTEKIMELMLLSFHSIMSKSRYGRYDCTRFSAIGLPLPARMNKLNLPGASPPMAATRLVYDTAA